MQYLVFNCALDIVLRVKKDQVYHEPLSIMRMKDEPIVKKQLRCLKIRSIRKVDRCPDWKVLKGLDTKAFPFVVVVPFCLEWHFVIEEVSKRSEEPSAYPIYVSVKSSALGKQNSVPVLF